MGQKIRRLQLMGHVKIIQMFCRWSSHISKNQYHVGFCNKIYSLFYLQKKRNFQDTSFALENDSLSNIINPLVIVIIQLAFVVIIQDVYAFYAYDRFTSTKEKIAYYYSHMQTKQSLIINHLLYQTALLTFGIVNFFNFNLSFYISGNETSHMCLSERMYFQFVLMKSIYN